MLSTHAGLSYFNFISTRLAPAAPQRLLLSTPACQRDNTAPRKPDPQNPTQTQLSPGIFFQVPGSAASPLPAPRSRRDPGRSLPITRPCQRRQPAAPPRTTAAAMLRPATSAQPPPAPPSGSRASQPAPSPRGRAANPQRAKGEGPALPPRDGRGGEGRGGGRVAAGEPHWGAGGAGGASPLRGGGGRPAQNGGAAGRGEAWCPAAGRVGVASSCWAPPGAARLGWGCVEQRGLLQPGVRGGGIIPCFY